MTSVNKLKSYRFATAAQWDSCLFIQADQNMLRARGAVTPYLPYAAPGLLRSDGARAPVITRAREILWCDDKADLHRSRPDDEESHTNPAPCSFTKSPRIVAATGGFWFVSGTNALHLRDADTLTVILAVDLPGARIVDIAAASGDAVYALLERSGAFQAVRISGAGRQVEAVTFNGLSQPEAFAYLRDSGRFIVLTGGSHQRLYPFAAQGGDPLSSRLIASIQPCFHATAMASDARARVFLAGEADGSGFILALDADTGILTAIEIAAPDLPVSGLAASRDTLVAAGPRGVLRFTASSAVPDNAGEARCMLITPMLESPLREAEAPWLRIDAAVRLPRGSRLEISYAATDSAEVRDRVKRILDDPSLPASKRAQALIDDPDLRRSSIAYQGDDRTPAATRSAPLHDLTESYLWVSVELSAAAGAELPALTELSVQYPGHSLIQNLPAIYRRTTTPPNTLVRRLVGVLETTTQDIDGRIGAMGSHVHPSTASGPWIDFVARWLGLPWDDGLAAEQKKRLLSNAAGIAKGRGSRAGLELLLESIMPGEPRRFRVTDASADYGFAVVGGGSCQGSALPAMLGGASRWNTELDASAVLGHMRLPCPGKVDDPAARFAGTIRIEVAPGATERIAWEPWLLRLITEMVPLTARIDLRWVSARALRSSGRLDGSLVLSSSAPAELGSGAVIGFARLPDVRAGLPSQGQPIRTRLR